MATGRAETVIKQHHQESVWTAAGSSSAALSPSTVLEDVAAMSSTFPAMYAMSGFAEETTAISSQAVDVTTLFVDPSIEGSETVVSSVNLHLHKHDTLQTAELSPTSGRPNIPSLHDIRARNEQLPGSSVQGPHMDHLPSDEENLARAIFDNILLPIFITQADIAGMSLAVADYLSWIRRAPAQTTENYFAFLETLEVRMREVNQLASEKHWMQARQGVLAVGKVNVFNLFGSLEKEVVERTMETEEFFRDRYDILTPLRDQKSG